MFDIGWGELVVIGVVALIAIGPKELPGVLRSLGQWMGKIRRMSAEFQSQFQEALREAEVADLRKEAEDIKSSVSNFAHFDPLADTPSAAPHTETSSEAAPQAEPESALPASAEQKIDVPLPDPPPPVTSSDFASPAEAEPPPAKSAGGGV
ncbi:Sec-independent protein translocase protein TatB [Microbacteriaceae bacterium K1510]|nr:Sec-independent protein translocase protein TatB [Microbacteriaceae bacterium K1510]